MTDVETLDGAGLVVEPILLVTIVHSLEDGERLGEVLRVEMRGVEQVDQ